MDCPAIPQFPYSEFTRSLNRKIFSQRTPVSGSLELTQKCNLSCLHCYCLSHWQKEELSTKEIYRIIDEVADAGCLWLLLTGGEPLLRPDFIPIYRVIRRKGIFVTLYTNGTLLNDEVVEILSEYPPMAIEITLYGATQNTYESITGIPGSYERCLKAIEVLCEKKLPLGLKTMVMTLNKHELKTMQDFAAARNLSFRFDADINPCLDGSLAPLQYRLKPDEVLALDREDEKRVQQWQEFCQEHWGAPEDDTVFVCAAGKTLFHIDSCARVSPCIGASSLNFSLREYSFEKIWNTFIPRVLDKKIKGYSACRHCELISICGHCPGWAYLETASYQKPVGYACELAHLRAKEFRPKEEVLDEEKVRETANQRS